MSEENQFLIIVSAFFLLIFSLIIWNIYLSFSIRKREKELAVSGKVFREKFRADMNQTLTEITNEEDETVIKEKINDFLKRHDG